IIFKLITMQLSLDAKNHSLKIYNHFVSESSCSAYAALGEFGGRVLLEYYINKIQMNEQDLFSYFEKAFDKINSSHSNPFYYDGLAGFLDIVNFLIKKEALDPDIIDDQNMDVLNGFV